MSRLDGPFNHRRKFEEPKVPLWWKLLAAGVALVKLAVIATALWAVVILVNLAAHRWGR
jgi:hypothetical protein